MFTGKMNGEAGSFRGAGNFFPDPLMDALTRELTSRGHTYLLNRFAFLAPNLLARVTRAFALVRLRRIEAADIRRYLAN